MRKSPFWFSGKKDNKIKLLIEKDTLDHQWFSTFGCWGPIIQNNIQFGDPKVSDRDPKMGRDQTVEKHCFRQT